MGKGDEEQPPDSSQEPPESDAGYAAAYACGRRCGRFVRPRCVVALVLGVAVLISALFWLPPFMRRRGDLDQSSSADIVASFRLQRMVSQLSENLTKLESDIFDEIGSPDSAVVIISLNPVRNSNWTTVVFGIWPYPSNSTLSPTWISILRSSFTSLVIEEWALHLTPSLFGNSSSFQVQKFPGGITIIPPQNAFLLQNPYALFNFSLNFPICTVQERVDELKDQMRQGLLLAFNENLYVKLTNLEGSTVASPTIVQTSVILAVGSNQPRLKQLAQTISNSSAGSNLGLNHTVFGRVKQISLSSFLQHSLNTGSSAPSPAPNPQSNPDHRYHLQHHHHHHHQHHHHHHHHHHHYHHDHHHDGHDHKHPGRALAPMYRDIAPPIYKDTPTPSSPVVFGAPPLRAVIFGSAQPPDNVASSVSSHGVLPIPPAPSPSAASRRYHLSLLWPVVLLLYLYRAFVVI